MARKLALYKADALEALKTEVQQILAEPDVGLRLIKIDEMQERLRAKDAPHRTKFNKFLRSGPVMGTTVGGLIVGPPTAVGLMLAPFDSGLSFVVLTFIGGVAGIFGAAKSIDAVSSAVIKDYLKGVIEPLSDEKSRFIKEKTETRGETSVRVWRVQEDNFDEFARSQHLEETMKKFPFLKDEFKRVVKRRKDAAEAMEKACLREVREREEVRKIIESAREITGQNPQAAKAQTPTIPPKFRSAETGVTKPRR